MNTKEVEEALEELEQRVERLRALFEQYFMGIEKIEPAVLRKDVDRRFWILRRAQIRNTAMRFKLNTINQRYNTYQQYWQRSIREIEAGTYRRHLIRAEKRFGAEALTIAARKRFRKPQESSEEDKRAIEERARRALEQVPDLETFDDIDFGDDEEIFQESDQNTQKVKQAQIAKQVHALNDLDDLESLMGLDAGPTVAGVPRSPGVQPRSQPARPQPPMEPKARQAHGGFGDLGGVFAEDEDDQTAPQRRIPLHTGAPPPLPQPPIPKPSPKPSPLQRASTPGASVLPPPVPPPRPPLQQPSSPLVRPSAPTQPTANRNIPPPRPPQHASAARPTPPLRPVQPNGQPNKPQAPAVHQPSKQNSPPIKTADASTIPDDRVRELYREYVNAKRQCNESTSSITEASLAKSLRGTAEKLSKKHKGRRVDYEVVIKDGRAVLKPVVKG